ncbi:RNA 2',3'-cyclic phosphodiesterase [Legionella sp. D16C41]|uniref:RNA 2',3'-cyclic phosphodiesterase n=1 Tax=Legionella sp. D16C41 TaxID=3402688 RepID=UPI003AF53E8C
MANTIRAFFAISLSPEVSQTIALIIEQLKQQIPPRKVRWVNAKHLHITLRFIQAVKLADLPIICEQVALHLKTIKAFKLELNEIELFPKPKCPRLITVKVGPEEPLAFISYQLAQILDALNYPTEKRAFRGHITLGRLQNYLPSTDIFQEIQQPVFPQQVAQCINLLQSKLEKNQREYLLIKQFCLQS